MATVGGVNISVSMPSNPVTYGTTAGTAAEGNHTHGLSISSLVPQGSNIVVLSANTSYTLTAGGSTIYFKTPVDNNTVTSVCELEGDVSAEDIGGALVSAGYIPTVYAWAQAATKPSYDFSEITGSLSRTQMNAGINNLSEGESPATADDYLVAQYAGGGTTTTSCHRRKVSNVVNATIVKAALGTGSGTTKFLREDGTWQTPSAISNYVTTDTDQNNLGGAKTWTQNASGQAIVYGNVSTKIEYTGITFSAKALGVSGTSTYTLAADTTGLKIGSNYIIHSGNIGSQSVNYATSAGSATDSTKLQTARTIWGKSFDGSGNVSGDMSDVGKINGAVSITSGTTTLPLLNITRVTANPDYISMYVTATHRPLVLQLNAGNVGVGVAQPSYKLHVGGSVGATEFTNTSDVRKKDIQDYYALVSVDTIANAPAVRFKWKEGQDKSLHCGSLAQYWDTVMPECVTHDNQGYLSMQYDVIALLAAISIAKKVVNHEERIAELERENIALRNEINNLKAA